MIALRTPISNKIARTAGEFPVNGYAFRPDATVVDPETDHYGRQAQWNLP